MWEPILTLSEMPCTSEAHDHSRVFHGIPPPTFDLPLLDTPDIITANVQKLIEQTPNPRHSFIFKVLVMHLHQFVNETRLTTDELKATINFFTRTRQNSSQEISLLSSVLGVSALVAMLNNPVTGGATDHSPLGPFFKFAEDTADVDFGESIASEGKGDYMYVEGRILTTEGQPIPNAIIYTWETDANGFYDIEYADRSQIDCRGRLRSDDNGKFGYRAVVPAPYAIYGDGLVGELLRLLGRHNMRPSHIHMMSLKDIVDDEEARKRGFPRGGSFKLLQYDIVLLTEEQSAVMCARVEKERGIITGGGKY
ncbi:Intradiol ring-cleavage dioxygenase [Suillus paluster]|uniref:Intradiol ring-cleavage dioxygenase n=1 Tax=Suillus paluster TaxID=48578 RepID=UPI001B87777C|nr:Intradiol ring-cleavage dioxygenase [Suillus paluster]KAG1748454.1 Intradiol ring-cleavage dioxygenase [Suillus paluster]